jgi:hypothetical protein
VAGKLRAVWDSLFRWVIKENKKSLVEQKKEGVLHQWFSSVDNRDL